MSTPRCPRRQRLQGPLPVGPVQRQPATVQLRRSHARANALFTRVASLQLRLIAVAVYPDAGPWPPHDCRSTSSIRDRPETQATPARLLSRPPSTGVQRRPATRQLERASDVLRQSRSTRQASTTRVACVQPVRRTRR